MEQAERMKLAKKTFVHSHQEHLPRILPVQPGQIDNLKEGFEVGPPTVPKQTTLQRMQKFNLAEPNVWPNEEAFPNGGSRLEKLHNELQALSSTLLSLLAMSLGKSGDFFLPTSVTPSPLYDFSTTRHDLPR